MSIHTTELIRVYHIQRKIYHLAACFGAWPTHAPCVEHGIFKKNIKAEHVEILVG